MGFFDIACRRDNCPARVSHIDWQQRFNIAVYRYNFVRMSYTILLQWVYCLGYMHFVPKNVRRPGIELGSIAWKATMLTFTPPTLVAQVSKVK